MIITKIAVFIGCKLFPRFIYLKGDKSDLHTFNISEHSL